MTPTGPEPRLGLHPVTQFEGEELDMRLEAGNGKKRQTAVEREDSDFFVCQMLGENPEINKAVPNAPRGSVRLYEILRRNEVIKKTTSGD